MGEDSHLHDLHISLHSASVACCHAPRGHLTYILRPLPSQEFDAVKERLSKEKFEGGCSGEGARCGGSGAVHSIRTIHATIRAQPITHQLFPGSICPPMPASCCGTAPASSSLAPCLHCTVVYDINGRESIEAQPVLDGCRATLEQYIYCSSAGVYLKNDQVGGSAAVGGVDCMGGRGMYYIRPKCGRGWVHRCCVTAGTRASTLPQSVGPLGGTFPVSSSAGLT